MGEIRSKRCEGVGITWYEESSESTSLDESCPKNGEKIRKKRGKKGKKR